jgi:hypothetical protein
MEQTSEYKGRRSTRRFAFGMLSIVAVLALAASAFLFTKYQAALKNNPTREREQILAAISQVVALPQETPGFSTVIDASKLTNPTLKARAKNGDLLIIYAKAKRLVIYRPPASKVVDMLTIQTSQPVAGTTETTAETAD